MIGKRQFTLSYLLVEVALFGVAMGLTRLVLLSAFTTNGIDNPWIQLLVFITALSCWGAAIGGLFGKMVQGVIWTPICGYVLAHLLSMYG